MSHRPSPFPAPEVKRVAQSVLTPMNPNVPRMSSRPRTNKLTRMKTSEHIARNVDPLTRPSALGSLMTAVADENMQHIVLLQLDSQTIAPALLSCRSVNMALRPYLQALRVSAPWGKTLKSRRLRATRMPQNTSPPIRPHTRLRTHDWLVQLALGARMKPSTVSLGMSILWRTVFEANLSNFEFESETPLLVVVCLEIAAKMDEYMNLGLSHVAMWASQVSVGMHFTAKAAKKAELWVLRAINFGVDRWTGGHFMSFLLTTELAPQSADAIELARYFVDLSTSDPRFGDERSDMLAMAALMAGMLVADDVPLDRPLLKRQLITCFLIPNPTIEQLKHPPRALFERLTTLGDLLLTLPAESTNLGCHALFNQYSRVTSKYFQHVELGDANQAFV